MFQVDDKVICIDAESPKYANGTSIEPVDRWPLRINGIYTIEQVIAPFCYVKEIPLYGFRMDRFELAEKVDEDYEQFKREDNLPPMKSQSLWDEFKTWWLS